MIILGFLEKSHDPVIAIVSVFGTLGFAEEEFWSSCLKLLVVVMFIFIGV
jgi:amino acid transporter